MAFRFVHASDLHLGKAFTRLPEEVRGRLREARFEALLRLAETARAAGAGHVLLAGDSFDTQTPSAATLRQALQAMAEDPELHWWLLPGNHDSLAAEALWDRLRGEAPANVHLLDRPEPVMLAPGATLLPAPLTARHPGRDPTAWMDAAPSPPGTLRIGLAHGPVTDFAAGGSPSPEVIPPDRAERAGLAYLALGDWHGRQQITPRTRYSGTPERDSFRHEGRGGCLVVTLPGPGAMPEVQEVDIGRFAWSAPVLELYPEEDALAALAALLPEEGLARRDRIMRIRVRGRVRLGARAALERELQAQAPSFGYLEWDLAALATEAGPEDLAAVDVGGVARHALEQLMAEAGDPSIPPEERRRAEAALRRLHGYLLELGR